MPEAFLLVTPYPSGLLGAGSGRLTTASANVDIPIPFDHIPVTHPNDASLRRLRQRANPRNQPQGEGPRGNQAVPP
jgi:hypothetical protein